MFGEFLLTHEAVKGVTGIHTDLDRYNFFFENIGFIKLKTTENISGFIQNDLYNRETREVQDVPL